MILNTYYEDVEYEHPDDKIKVLYPSEEEAIYALYEQLFDTRHKICAETVLNSMKYLIFSKGMDKQMEEIRQMEPYDLCVIHQYELNNSVEQATKEIKKKLYDILEDKLF